MELGGNLIVIEPLGRKENHLGTDYDEIGQRIFPGAPS
jgi:hypothetical protein